MSQPTCFDRIVFCDFDGTITAVETFAGMLKAFAPELSAVVMPQLYSRQLTLRQGVRQMLSSIPSSHYPEILAYAAERPIRPGLANLLEFLAVHNVPFVIISGGLQGMVETVLEREKLSGQVMAIVAVEVDTSDEYLQVYSEFEGGTELIAKVQAMAKYPAYKTIAIGDSVTDINMALSADLVFARDRLIEYMEEANKPYMVWNDFFDIRDRLNYLWNQSEI